VAAVDVAPRTPTAPSWTSMGIALARAVESERTDRLFDDFLAVDFLAAAEHGLPFPAPGGSDTALRGFLSVAGDYVAVRTRFFDTHFRRACLAGCRQVVLLAAGLDTRAYRLTWPEDVRLFEVDLPDVLAFKDDVLVHNGHEPTCARSVVGADLRAGWPAALLEAGFRPEAPTAWLAEGALNCLDEPTCRALLEWVTELSAPGSRFAVEHLDRTLGELPLLRRAREEYGEFELTAEEFWGTGLAEAPAAWLDDRGWEADAYNPAQLAVCYRRPVPKMVDPAAGGGDVSRLVSARR
jgi:methyltransferase (TIGR00027 family)